MSAPDSSPLSASTTVTDAVPVALATSAWGRRDSPRRALLVHGLGSTGTEWWQIAEALAQDGYWVVAPDLRGHGDSPATSSYRLAELVSDLHELGGGWDLLIGHSIGGLLAATAAAADQTFARRVLLVDPVLDLPEEIAEQAIQAQLDQCRSTPGVEEMLAANPHWHPQDAIAKARFIRTANLYAVERWMRDNEPLHEIGQVLRLSVPTVVLGGDPDLGGTVPPELGQHLAAANPLVSYRLVAKAGHAIHRDDPAAVLDAAGHRGDDAPH